MSAENDSPGSPVGDENRAISPSELDISSITAADANTPAGASLANGMNGQGLKVIGFSEKEESDEDEEEKDDSEEEGEVRGRVAWQSKVYFGLEVWLGRGGGGLC